MDKSLRPYLAELIGTFALVFLGAGTVCATQMAIGTGQPQAFALNVALAEGFVLAALLAATVDISGGYLNPAITLMLWVYKRMDGLKATWLIAAQVLGAALAGLCLRLMFNEEVLKSANFGTPHVNLTAFGQNVAEPTVRILLSGIGIEVALTFILTFAIFGTIIDPRGQRMAGLGVGLTLAACVLMGYGITGAATNPARWFGPCLWEVTIRPTAFRDHAVYWIGPIVGALLAGGVYVYLILPDVQEQPAAAAGTSQAVVGATLFKSKK
jgi:MIP family channel proteins